MMLIIIFQCTKTVTVISTVIFFGMIKSIYLFTNSPYLGVYSKNNLNIEDKYSNYWNKNHQ